MLLFPLTPRATRRPIHFCGNGPMNDLLFSLATAIQQRQCLVIVLPTVSGPLRCNIFFAVGAEFPCNRTGAGRSAVIAVFTMCSWFSSRNVLKVRRCSVTLFQMFPKCFSHPLVPNVCPLGLRRGALISSQQNLFPPDGSEAGNSHNVRTFQQQSDLLVLACPVPPVNQLTQSVNSSLPVSVIKKMASLRAVRCLQRQCHDARCCECRDRLSEARDRLARWQVRAQQ